MRNLGVMLFFALSSMIAWYVLEGFVVRNIITLILVLLAAQILLNEVLESYLGAKMKRKYFNLLIAPGTIIHEASHAFMAKATGCDITNISFFSATSRNNVLGYVEYTQPVDRFRPMRRVLIGFAPFFGCGFFLVAILNYLAMQYPGLDIIGPGFLRLDGIEALVYNAEFILTAFYQQLMVLDLSNPAILLILYLEFSFALGSVPSPQDISDAFNSLLEFRIEALTMVLFVISFVLLTEHAGDFWSQGDAFSEAAILFTKWITLVLMLSTSMLLIALPLTYIATETFKIRGYPKAIPLTVFILLYYLSRNVLSVSPEASLVASVSGYLISLVVVSHPNYFIDERRRY